MTGEMVSNLLLALAIGFVGGLLAFPSFAEFAKAVGLQWKYRGWKTRVATISKVNKRSVRVDVGFPSFKVGDVLMIFYRTETDLFGEVRR